MEGASTLLQGVYTLFNTAEVSTLFLISRSIVLTLYHMEYQPYFIFHEKYKKGKAYFIIQGVSTLFHTAWSIYLI